MCSLIHVNGDRVTNTYEISNIPEHTKLCITADDGSYSYTTVVDTDIVYELRNFVWHLQQTEDKGTYFATTLNQKTKKHLARLKICENVVKTLLLHRFILFLCKVPNPLSFRTVDHISRESFDNRLKNLRWLSQSDQNKNRDKVARHSNARNLPTDINVTELPKYCTWNSNNKGIDYFRIEGHPALTIKCKNSSKSKAVSNQKKYDQAMKILEDLDNMLK